MKAVLQRVRYCNVKINDKVECEIGTGMLVLLGIENGDNCDELEWLCQKIAKIRIFSDADGKMNLDINSVGGEILLVSQFTLHASTVKGNRPSFMLAAKPEDAKLLYLKCAERLNELVEKPLKKGVFGADMQIELCNDGPVTIVIDSRNRL
ncbi:MAG: D-tyrosyl-tRNA(Tyr) deacylase [Bacteroidetes bacterium]|nr:D-tyrosyl-tRNA(Tyr) deacylase [Bacteroidota bacterium]